MERPNSSDDRILLKRTVLERVPVNHVTLWRMERRGDFPQRVQISPGRVGWLESEVNAWLEQRKSSR
jgi:prophage regulatory protein